MDVWPLPRISFRGLSSIDEKRPVALMTQPSAWAIVSQLVKLPLVIQAEPTRNDSEFVNYLAANLPAPVEAIYAIGEGSLIDVAKAVASANNIPLIVIPSAISSEAPFTPSALVRENGKLTATPTGSADEVIIDFDLIKRASPDVRAAGIVELLSIVSGLLDWGYSAQKGKFTPGTKPAPWAMGIAAGIASQALKNAAAIGKGDSDALHLLVDLLCMMVQLDSQLGHHRASQGIEHIFAESVNADPGVSHGERVAPGILIASALYNKDVPGMRAALESAGVRLDRLKADDIRAAVNALPDTVKKNDAPYSILNDLAPNAPELEQALNKSTLFATK
ncbi:MAG: iron-containing alcohol dehydrogenase [Chloroflexota bacterium]